MENNIQNSNEVKVLTLNVRGTPFIIGSYIIERIPLFETLYETKSTDVIELKEIPPNFLIHLIHFYTMQQKYIEFKKILDREFEKQDINIFFKYLGIDGLYDKLYGRKNVIDGMLVIYSYNSSYGYELSNGSTTSGGGLLDKALFLINDVIIEDCEHYICVQRQRRHGETDVFHKYYISKQKIICDMDSYFAPFSMWSEMNRHFKLLSCSM